VSRATSVLISLAVLSVSAGIASAQETLYSPLPDSHRARVTAQAALVGQFAANHSRNQELRTAREKGFLDTLHEVEKAAVPVPDDPPIRYPSQERWRLVSSRRPAGEQSRGLSAREASEKKIEEALQSPTEFDFVQVRLTDAIEYLKDLHDVEIQFDRYALAQEGLGTDIPITRKLKGISLRSALQLILRDFGLTYVVEDEVILITTQQRAKKMRKTRVYGIGDLMLPRPRPLALPRPYVPVRYPSYPVPTYTYESTTTIVTR